MIITDFNADDGEGKQYFIRTYGGARHCQFWCTPDVPFVCDSDDSLCDYDYEHSAKYEGQTVVNGVRTDMVGGEGGVGDASYHLFVLSGSGTRIWAPSP